jgi:protein-tyrosine phosphatase
MLAFLLIGGGFLAEAVILRGLAWVLLWPGAAFLVVGAAYAGLGARVLGKRPDGRIAWPAQVVLLPYLLVVRLLWNLHRRFSASPCCDEVVPGLWVGRRPGRGELPEGVRLVVDLTAEFPAPAGIAADVRYRCLPTLDACAPEPEPLLELVRLIVDSPGGVYIHCANGYGRSPTVAAAVVMAKGLADGARQAVALVRRVRTKTNLSRSQERVLEDLARSLLALGKS